MCFYKPPNNDGCEKVNKLFGAEDQTNEEQRVRNLYHAVIYITTKNGSVQSFQKSDKLGWVQTSSKGVERTCTAEQVLSHILPLLANKQKYEKLATLKVEVKND